MARHLWLGLDGLRGIAVLSVIAFHLSLGWAINGYVGVDVFFALSGFLITWLLLDEKARTGSIALGGFYARRFLRLYPALVVTTLAVVALGIAARRVERVLGGALAALAYAANWWINLGGDAALLEHTWTLAIEEHFYLVWPVLVVLLTAARARFRVLGGVLAVAVLAVLLAAWPPWLEAVRGTYLRGAPIVWGSILAVVIGYRLPGPRLRASAGYAGLVALAVLLVVEATPTVLPGEWMTGLLSVPGMLAIIVIAAAVTAQGSLVERILAWAPLRWVGRRAYGLYLYHYPLVMLVGFQLPWNLPSQARPALAFALTLVLAAISYKWLESPFLRMKSRFSTDRT